jgi:hypothetical protein
VETEPRRTTKAPPDERGGNRHVQPTATAPQQKENIGRARFHCHIVRHVSILKRRPAMPRQPSSRRIAPVRSRLPAAGFRRGRASSRSRGVFTHEFDVFPGIPVQRGKLGHQFVARGFGGLAFGGCAYLRLIAVAGDYSFDDGGICRMAAGRERPDDIVLSSVNPGQPSPR